MGHLFFRRIVMQGNVPKQIRWPLFPEEPHVWESLDKEIQAELEYLIARLLAIHIDQSLNQPNQLPNIKDDQS
jgi:hypothetical protein